MRRKEMADLLRRYSVRLNILARKIAARYDEEDIHDFRVLVKKLRAFIRLVSPAAGRRRLPKRLRLFYHAVGAIRNLQLQRAGLQKVIDGGHTKSVETLLGHLDEELAAAKMSAGKLLQPGERPFGNLAAKLTAELPARIDQGHRHRFLAANSQVIDPTTFPQLPDDERLHTLRKSIKDLLYTWPWLGNRGRKLAAERLGGHKAMKKAGRLLGEYLDLRLKLQLLAGQDAAHGFYAHLRDDWAEERTTLRRQIDLSLGQKLHFATRPQIHPSDTPVNPLSGNTPSLSNELHLD
ncbi:MAG TPA: CHAD domain-containing protein [Puia sp.]|uniref:CHAD domain-containing protein n=1 Tax=Puia sp. TaxID=2045100 RepID=UPI002C066F65|nr:CHAD domain-containing protein [Puia sp.]HVU94192.1 CHAD domain-containing protein [Puia sp.]